jgi:hypothetical protein
MASEPDPHPRDLDERVKIDLPPEAALRALLKTPPPDNSSAKRPKKPSPKKRAKS